MLHANYRTLLVTACLALAHLISLTFQFANVGTLQLGSGVRPVQRLPDMGKPRKNSRTAIHVKPFNAQIDRQFIRANPILAIATPVVRKFMRPKITNQFENEWKKSLDAAPKWTTIDIGLRKWEDDMSVVKLLHQIEKENGIQILYAAETGVRQSFPYLGKHTSAEINADFVYIRTKPAANTTTKASSKNHLILSDETVFRMSTRDLRGRIHLTGYSLDLALNSAIRMHPPLVEMFYSSNVYELKRDNNNNKTTNATKASTQWSSTEFAEQMQAILEEPSMVSRMLKSYRDFTRHTVIDFLENNGYSAEVEVNEYIRLVRHIMMFEWQVLVHEMTFDEDSLVNGLPFVELNFERVMYDLTASLDPTLSKFHRRFLPDEVNSAITELVARRKEMIHEDETMPRSSVLDAWMDRIVDSPFFFEYEAKEPSSDVMSAIGAFRVSIWNSLRE